MNYDFNITLSKESRLSTVDFDNLVFGKIFSDHMFVADYVDGQWTNLEIRPTATMEVHPANMAWHYGQSIFEGMKATRDDIGTPLLFRPEMHAVRMNKSAVRMCMPEIPEDMFVQAVSNLVALDKAWIPPAQGSALYVRPFMFATDEYVGVRPSETYRFIIICAPVGPYYAKPVKLKAEETYVRAAVGGVGEAKTAGNYAASLYPAMLAKKEGYDQIMWLDAKEFKFIQEVGTMNIFFLIDGKVVTPATDGTILKGITRDTMMHIMKDKGLEVEVRPISIDELLQAYDAGKLQEVFGTGTAAVVAIVSDIKYKDRVLSLDAENYVVGPMLKETINGIRAKKIADTHGWIQEATIELQAV